MAILQATCDANVLSNFGVGYPDGERGSRELHSLSGKLSACYNNADAFYSNSGEKYLRDNPTHHLCFIDDATGTGDGKCVLAVQETQEVLCKWEDFDPLFNYEGWEPA